MPVTRIFNLWLQRNHFYTHLIHTQHIKQTTTVSVGWQKRSSIILLRKPLLLPLSERFLTITKQFIHINKTADLLHFLTCIKTALWSWPSYYYYYYYYKCQDYGDTITKKLQGHLHKLRLKNMSKFSSSRKKEKKWCLHPAYVPCLPFF